MATRRKLPSGKYQFIIRIAGHKLKGFTGWNIGVHAVTKYFGWACRDAEIKGLCFHCTRHTGVSRLAEVLTPIQVAAISGHKSGRMLLHYSHPDIEALAKRLG